MYKYFSKKWYKLHLTIPNLIFIIFQYFALFIFSNVYIKITRIIHFNVLLIKYLHTFKPLESGVGIAIYVFKASSLKNNHSNKV